MERFKICKLRADHTLDFAAEELKKYLRMMMPDTPDIPIGFDPEAKEGFCLGLLEDFGLPNEAEDLLLDDVVHIDTDEKGGVLAGSNPRSVLFAVYRYFRLNGCRWLFPGPDGEFIPMKRVEPQKYHKMADHRYRGHTTEGDPSERHVLDYIDFMAKQELNFYGIFGIYTYHRRYYLHAQNADTRAPEPVSAELCRQWKGMMESEILKRGLLLADGTHDFTMMVLGLDPADRYDYRDGKKKFPEDKKKYLAMVNGKRELFKNDPFYTQFCMSRADFRERYVKLLADYAEEHPQITFIGASLGDSHHNHCECPECQKGTPSDFQVMILNELDEELTRRGLNTRLGISTYVDKMFPPLHERIKNPARFNLSFAPITRSYSSSVTEDTVIPEPKPYVRNKWETPKGMAECVSYLKAWQKVCPVDGRTYEYHFWRAQMRDPALMNISRRIYEDMFSLKLIGLSGDLEDGSNRHYFPHGFHCHIYAETLVHRDLDYEAEKEDYFSHLFGEDWKEAVSVLQGVSDAFGEKYMEGEESEDPARGAHFAPSRAAKFAAVKELAARERALAKKHLQAPTRPQTVAYRLLDRHAEYAEGIAGVFYEKCLGHDQLALERFRRFASEFGKHEFELDAYMDFGLAIRSLEVPVKKMPVIEY